MRKLAALMIIATFGLCLTSCSKDDDGPGNTSGNYGDKPARVSKPTVSEVAGSTTSTDFDVTFKVKSEEEPSSVILHYVSYSNKSTTVSESKCSKTSSCTFQKVEGKSSKYWYYRARHTGFHQGYYIYYYVEASNSSGTAKTAVKSRVFKRI